MTNSGPLAGVKVLELGGIGPGPHAAMVLADLGADVVRVDRTAPAGFGSLPGDLLHRNRRSVAVDLKSDAGREVVLALVERLRERKFVLLDTQWTTPHLRQFGAVEIPRKKYLHLLTTAVNLPRTFL